MAHPPRPVQPLPGTPAEDTEEGVRTGEVSRTLIVLTAVFGQLWALTVSLEEFLSGHAGRAWWLAGFSIVSFVLVVVLVQIGPAVRSRRRSGRR